MSSPSARLISNLSLLATSGCKESTYDREELARRLCSQKGVYYDALRHNTLDEEPQDGLFPCGAPGHFAWREMLTGADRILGSL